MADQIVRIEGVIKKADVYFEHECPECGDLHEGETVVRNRPVNLEITGITMETTDEELDRAIEDQITKWFQEREDEELEYNSIQWAVGGLVIHRRDQSEAEWMREKGYQELIQCV